MIERKSLPEFEEAHAPNPKVTKARRPMNLSKRPLFARCSAVLSRRFKNHPSVIRHITLLASIKNVI
jgi:hypothetical protein